MLEGSRLLLWGAVGWSDMPLPPGGPSKSDIGTLVWVTTSQHTLPSVRALPTTPGDPPSPATQTSVPCAWQEVVKRLQDVEDENEEEMSLHLSRCVGSACLAHS